MVALAFLLLCSSAGAQGAYYNSTVGSTLTWLIREGSGKLYGYCDETLVSLEGNMGNARINYSYMFRDAGGKSVIGIKPFDFSVRIEDGKTLAFVNNTAKAVKGGDFMPVGDLSSIPGNIAVGDRLKESEIVIKVLSIFTARNSYRNRRVVARESVAVPAGRFDCFLIEDEESFTGAGPFRVQTWVANGIGIVRQVIYKKDGSVNQIFELVNHQ